MSVEAPEDVDRADAQARALEAAIAAAVVAVIAFRVRGIIADLTDAFRWADAAPGRWATARFYVAARLRAIPVRLAETVEPMLWRAARLGADQVGAPLPAGYDPTIRPQVRAVLDRVDGTVQDRLRDAARTVADGRIDTPAQLAQVTARVEAVASTARARVEDAVARTVADGAHASVYGAPTGEGPAGTGGETAGPNPDPTPGPDGLAPRPGPAADLAWRSERRACLSCASLAGALPGPDGLYRPVLAVAKLSPYIAAGVVPPAHPHCRCRLVPATPGLADSLRREAQREVAYGWSAYDSLRARLRAADLLLRGGTLRLPKTVVGRARDAVDRGEFTQSPPPR